MGEIKSTLDLIMEKTKGWSLSPEEKEAYRRQEWFKKAKGWIQRFLDGLLELQEVQEALTEGEPPSGWERLLKEELVAGLDPEGNNGKRLLLLEKLLGLSSESYRKTLEEFHRKVAEFKAQRQDQLSRGLAASGISGTAVVANVDQDPEWRRFYEQERERCQRALQAH